jgi:fructose 1,6-bisphosphate aldolase/phosphatase
MTKGFRFVIMDVSYTEGDRIIELEAPKELYAIAALLRDPERYVVNSVWSVTTGAQAVSVATSRLHNIAGRYTGKDDPVMLVRVQSDFPATGEVLAPFATGHFVAGGMRGSHQMPLMPVPLGSGISYFDGPPIVTCAAFSMKNGRLTEPVDAFAHPFWDARARESVREGDRDAAAGFRGRGHGADGGARIHRHHHCARGARVPVRGRATDCHSPRCAGRDPGAGDRRHMLCNPAPRWRA